MYKFRIKFILCFITFMFGTVKLFSQGPEAPPEQPTVPITDFIPILFLVGVLLGMRIIFKDSKKII